jgi:sugar diacid utilization regulator
VLTLLDAGGGAAALDLPDPAAAHDALTAAIGGDVWLAVSDPVRPPGLPTAWRQARDVRRLTAVLDRPPGVWTVDDLLLERTLAADPAAAERLAAVLAPLEEREDLLRTLEVWFECDFDRRVAAAGLTIHPNTLDYRLRRISELVGRDLTSAAGTQLIGAALLARRLAP